MNKRIFIITILGFASLISLYSCKKEKNNGNTDNFDRRAMLTNYADNYILPGYLELVQQLQGLKLQTEQFNAAPDEAKLTALRTTWRTAYLSWQKTDLLEFGPAEDVSLRMYMNIYPASESRINANISAGSYDLEEFGNKDAQGFPALDYLLNGLGATNADIIASYATASDAANRRQYLQDVVNKMTGKAESVQVAWSSYRTTFVSDAGTDVNSSMSKMVNAFVLYYERYLRAAKIGLPAGAMTGVALPEHTETNYTPPLAKELAMTALDAVDKFYEGVSYDGATDGMGMKDYLAAIGTQDDNGQPMANVISEELDEAVVAVQALGTTIKDAAVTNRPALLSIYEELQDLVPLFKVDMISAFGISITYVDNDGD